MVRVPGGSNLGKCGRFLELDDRRSCLGGLRGGPTTGRREPEWEFLERWRGGRPSARDDRAVSDGVSKLTRSVGGGVPTFIPLCSLARRVRLGGEEEGEERGMEIRSWRIVGDADVKSFTRICAPVSLSPQFHYRPCRERCHDSWDKLAAFKCSHHFRACSHLPSSPPSQTTPQQRTSPRKTPPTALATETTIPFPLPTPERCPPTSRASRRRKGDPTR